MQGNSVIYLRWLAATVMLSAALVATCVVLIDPYGLYPAIPARPGINLIKPGLSRNADKIKLARAQALVAPVLILGNSRVEIGFDPDGPALAGSAFNLGIPGSGIGLAHAQLAQLVRAGKAPGLILQGLDFLDFVDAPPRPGSILIGAAPPPSTPIFWHYDSVLSLAALQDALLTLSIQHAPNARTGTLRGFNPLYEYRALARSEGYYSLFQQRAQENARVYLNKARGRRGGADYAHLDAMLDLAAGSGSKLRLIIYPYHAQILAMYEAAGLWPEWVHWKGALAQRVAAARRRHPAADITLYDFSGYGRYACEVIPARGDLSRTPRWYWEAGHFKAALGELMLARLLETSAAQPRLPPRTSDPASFGFRLEPATLAANEARIATERSACQLRYPSLFIDSAALVAAARNGGQRAAR